MSAGPLRRLVGMLGLLALLPTAVMLTTATITPEDAALRGGATLVAALVLGRVAGWGLSLLAAEFERPEDGEAMPQRRASDRGGQGS